MNAAQVSLGSVLQALENEPDTPERSQKLDSLGRIYRQIPGDALEANRDNLLGAFLYSRRTDADPAKAVNGSHSSPPNCRTTPYWRAYGGRSKPSNVRPSAGPTWTSH